MVDWQILPEKLLLNANESHLWRIHTVGKLNQVDELYSLLNSAEQQRVRRFHFTKDQHQSTIARGCLRLALAQYLNAAPQSFVFQQSEHGKLSLNSHPEFQFNVTHSGNYILFAFTLDEPIGVDVEYAKKLIEYRQLAERFFADCEAEQMMGFQDEALQQAFFRVWTQKEAFIKAVGEGLSFPLKEFAVPVASMKEAQVKLLTSRPIKDSVWMIKGFQAADDYLAAIVRKNQLGKLCFYDY